MAIVPSDHLVFRDTKGSPLTSAEGDQNFDFLNRTKADTTALNAAVAYLPGRNKIRNGAMRVAQRALGVQVANSSNARGGPDGFVCTNGAAGGVITQGKTTISYNGRVIPAIYQQASTVIADLSGSKYWSGITQNVEGQDVYEANGQPISISFPFYASIAGIYYVTINLTLADGSIYCFNQKINYTTPLVSQFFSITTPLVPTAKAIVATNAVGMTVRIGSLGGATFQCPLASVGQWNTSNYLCSTDFTNWAITANNLIAVGELQVEIGKPTPFERTLYGDDLARCQRYFCKTFADSVAPAHGLSAAGALFLTGGNGTSQQFNGVTWRFPRTMRASPSLIYYEPISSNSPGTWYDQANSANSLPGVIALGDAGALIAIASATAVVIGPGTAWYIHVTADADI